MPVVEVDTTEWLKTRGLLYMALKTLERIHFDDCSCPCRERATEALGTAADVLGYAACAELLYRDWLGKGTEGA